MRTFHTSPTADSVPAVAASIGNLFLPLENASDLDPLMERIGDAKYVLLGEASHGTHEYYTWRMKITQRLIREKGFSFVAVEGDWPDCYRVNRYAKGYAGSGAGTREVLKQFNRWPTWMWANWEVAAFVDWLRNFNDTSDAGRKVGFYGLDVYSLWESLQAVMSYLEENDPEALIMAKEAWRCFEPYGREGYDYARASSLVPELCKKQVLDLLLEIRKKAPLYNSDPEHVFSTEQNARIAVNAEKYYRAMINGGAGSWNIRDRHMAQTLEELMKFHGPEAKAVVWEHNTHIGDARATGMVTEKMVNVGQLVREEYPGRDVVLVGFGSYKGSVIAGRNWGDNMRKMPVPIAADGSWEHICHEAAPGRNSLLLMDGIRGYENLEDPLRHRAIGVVYNPWYEKYGNYVPSIMAQRYDAFIFIDESKALHPLHIKPDGNQVPETYPFGV